MTELHVLIQNRSLSSYTMKTLKNEDQMADEIIPNRCYSILQNDAKTKDFGNDCMSMSG